MWAAASSRGAEGGLGVLHHQRSAAQGGRAHSPSAMPCVCSGPPSAHLLICLPQRRARLQPKLSHPAAAHQVSQAVFSHKLGFPCITFLTQRWASHSQKAVPPAQLLRRACCPHPAAVRSTCCGGSPAASRHCPSTGCTADTGQGRCFSPAALKALDAIAAGCEKPGACQHHAEGLNASHRQEGQRELIRTH